MAQQEEIVLWLDHRWKKAIERHLKNETLQEHLENVLDELCNQLPAHEYARSILCEIKGGGRKRPPPSHKAPQCGAFSMVKQGEPCAPFFGCKVVGKAKKSGMASLCAVSYHKNRRFSHD